MSNYEDFFSLDDYINIIFKVEKKTNSSGGFYFDTFLFDDSSDEKSSELEDVLIISTRWKYLDWDSKRNILDESRIFDPVKSEVSYDPILYRDNLIKKCLMEWKFHGKDNKYVKVNDDRINGLPPDVVDKLLYFYEKAIEKEEDCLGKV
jgi:hypothetical protein|tara:strand:+ start:1387 stop:1833 length:447 start_codon:yes stop_codon:yes gene_type:complete